MSANVSHGPSTPFNVYVAKLTQSGTDAPVATVLQNEIGPIVWERAIAGAYECVLAGAFPLGGKTVVQVTIGLSPLAFTVKVAPSTPPTDRLNFRTFNLAGGLQELSGDMFVEIKVFP